MYIFRMQMLRVCERLHIGASTGAAWALSHLLKNLRHLLLGLPLRQRRLRRDVVGNDIFDTIAAALIVESGG